MEHFSSLTNRIAGKGSDAWAIHMEATDLELQGRDILKLTIGQESDQSTPSFIVEAAVENLRTGTHGYSELRGEPELRQAIVDNFNHSTGLQVGLENCFVFSGAQNALFSTSLCALEAGDEVIIIEPYYATYPATFTAGGAALVQVPSNPKENFQFDPQRVRDAVSSKTRAIIVNSPNNPGGIMYEWDHLKEVVEICANHGLCLISDEVYSTLVTPGTYRSPVSLPGALDFCITISSVSKSHRMSGWRLGWSIANEAMTERLFKLSLCMSYGLPGFIQHAATVAVRQSEQTSALVRNQLDQKRNTAIRELSDIEGIQVRGSQVGMFVVIDIEDLGTTSIEFSQRLLREYSIAILPCDGFGESCGNYLLRLCIGETEDQLARAYEMIRRCAADFLQLRR